MRVPYSEKQYISVLLVYNNKKDLSRKNDKCEGGKSFE